jgi:hypothetical protein
MEPSDEDDDDDDEVYGLYCINTAIETIYSISIVLLCRSISISNTFHLWECKLRCSSLNSNIVKVQL